MAMGQFILVRAATLRALGGFDHPTRRGALADDRAFALAVKATGRRVGFVEAPGLLRTSGYATWRQAWQGHAHHLIPTVVARSARARTSGALVAHALGTLFPTVALLATLGHGWWHGWRQVRMALLAYGPLAAAGMLVRWRAARLTHLPSGYVFAGPLGAALVEWLVVRALLQRSTTIAWKGQHYRQGQ